MTNISRIDMDKIDFENIAAWLCGDELTEEQKVDVLKHQISYDIATLHRHGIQDEFRLYEVKEE